MQFYLYNDLIYFKDFAGKVRLCLLKAFEKEIFYEAYNYNTYTGFNRTYKVIISNYFFRKLTRRLYRYIHYYYEYNLNQTKRHITYGLLILIVGSLIPHYTVAVDFILDLPVNKDNINAAISITYKFSKRNTVTIDKDTFSAEEWINIYLDVTVD